MEGGRWRHGDPVGFLKGPETTGFKLSPCVKLGRRRKAAEKKEKENRTDCPVTIPNSRCGFFLRIFSEVQQI